MWASFTLPLRPPQTRKPSKHNTHTLNHCGTRARQSQESVAPIRLIATQVHLGIFSLRQRRVSKSGGPQLPFPLSCELGTTCQKSSMERAAHPKRATACRKDLQSCDYLQGRPVKQGLEGPLSTYLQLSWSKRSTCTEVLAGPKAVAFQ